MYGGLFRFLVHGYRKSNAFSVSFVQKRLNKQLAAVMVRGKTYSSANYSKINLFIFASTYVKFKVIKDNCIAHHDKEMWFWPNCRYNNKLMRDLEDLLQQLDVFCFTSQQVESLHTLFKRQFSDNFVVKSRQMFDEVPKVVYFNHRTKGMDRTPSIAKKRLLWKKNRKHLLSLFQKTKATQTSRSVLPEKMESGEKSNKELELKKM